MKDFNTKIPSECIIRLCTYITQKDLTLDDAYSKILAYCSALYDIGILTFREKTETSLMLRERLLKERLEK